MAVYSIRDLEKLSGIKAHTIRIWEQRYNIIDPKRTETNIRYYSDDDLKYLLNIALLNKNGIRISKIAKMSREEIAERVSSLAEVNFEDSTQLSALTISMVELNEFKFLRIFEAHIEQLGFEEAMLKLITPFLEKLSLLWLTGSISPIHERFVTCLIRQKIIVATEKLPIPNNKDAKKFIIFLPEGETHELPALFVQYLLRARHQKVVYLGGNIPLDDLKLLHRLHQPDCVYSYLSEGFTEIPTQQFLKDLEAIFPSTHLMLAGYQVTAQSLRLPRNSKVLNGMEDTVEYLDELLI